MSFWQIFGETATTATHIRVNSTLPLVSQEVIVDFEIQPGLPLRESVVATGVPMTADQTVVVPQYATGAGWFSILELIEASGLPQAIHITRENFSRSKARSAI